MTAWRNQGTYYNDKDPFACAWLEELIKAGELPDGSVDARSIIEIVPSDLGPFRQCHFFAGIGGWPHALALARWPEDREIWTASLPCQPLSVAGKRHGALDGRHLWPAFYRLLSVCRPATVVGEQVASLDGREWLAGIRIDLEELGYACGAANLPACAVGAPHRRERLYWVALADASGGGSLEPIDGRELATGVRQPQPQGRGGMGDADRPGWPLRVWLAGNDGAAQREAAREAAQQTGHWSNAEWRVGADGKARRVEPGIRLLAHGFPNRVGLLRGFGNAIVPQIAAQFVRAVGGIGRGD